MESISYWRLIEIKHQYWMYLIPHLFSIWNERGYLLLRDMMRPHADITK